MNDANKWRHNLKYRASMESYLKKMGFEDKETRVYRACLDSIKTTPADIVKETMIRRSTVYLCLEKLKGKGLIGTRIAGRRKYIFAVSPKEAFENFLAGEEEKLKQNRKIIRKLKIRLEKSGSQKNRETEVSLYEGSAGAKIVIDKVLKSKEDIYWLGSLDNLRSVMSDEEFYRKMTLERMKGKTTLYVITDDERLKSARRRDNYGNFRKVKLLEKRYDIPATLAMFGDKLMIGSAKDKKIRIVLIEDAAMARAVRFLFNNLWERME